jgi:decaprenyl-phosphate phosphoribosyltransferase
MTIKINYYLKLIRVHQWVKNTFIWMPAFFASKIDNLENIQKLFIAFFSFSLIASSVYIINDYVDIEKDKIHPTKSQRPLAKGTVSKKEAIICFFVVFILGLLGALSLNFFFLGIVATYFIMNMLYCFYLKKVALIDIIIIAFGFLLRIFAGGVILHIVLSKWLIILTFLLALFLGLAKRRDDVLLMNNDGILARKSVKGYNLEFINVAMGMIASVIIVAYIMYAVSPDLANRLHYDSAYLPVFPVIIGILRYFQITFVEQKSSDPTQILLKDKFILITVLSWIIINLLLIYF